MLGHIEVVPRETSILGRGSAIMVVKMGKAWARWANFVFLQTHVECHNSLLHPGH